MNEDIRKREKVLGYVSKDKSVLTRAVAYVNRHDSPDSAAEGYQLLEFLGDRVINLFMAERIVELFSDRPLSTINAIHASARSNVRLAEAGRDLNLGRYLRFPLGQEQPWMRGHAKTLADLFEAVVAGIFLDSGSDYQQVYAVLNRHLFRGKHDLLPVTKGSNAIRTLELLAIEIYGQAVKFEVTRLAHNPKNPFCGEVYLGGVCLGMVYRLTEFKAKNEVALKVLKSTKNLRTNLPPGLPKPKV